MSHYTDYDFAESLRSVGLEPGTVKNVIAAWGENGDYSEWTGGFLFQLMADGRFAYLSGWCDTTGWGCQDGAEIEYFDTEPIPEELELGKNWDKFPPDLNNWLVNQEN